MRPSGFVMRCKMSLPVLPRPILIDYLSTVLAGLALVCACTGSRWSQRPRTDGRRAICYHGIMSHDE